MYLTMLYLMLSFYCKTVFSLDTLRLPTSTACLVVDKVDNLSYTLVRFMGGLFPMARSIIFNRSPQIDPNVRLGF